ncbi:hypothetical protein BGZ61DRAFT_473657 [Ilyonectria robusta]|uniref:uncharacterized protein n=1 Tax=Ilyonectria robusta TaxID=1079257 RepID=UPI001E8D6975|nr:uncharacterized protein BGZ61DRAFT_473657 [Ilyonectria robusta]KAH8735000.1 hypothetical protein BGZ61DRAFT_473657 [Ilyonectria robusta]
MDLSNWLCQTRAANGSDAISQEALVALPKAALKVAEEAVPAPDSKPDSESEEDFILPVAPRNAVKNANPARTLFHADDLEKTQIGKDIFPESPVQLTLVKGGRPNSLSTKVTKSPCSCPQPEPNGRSGGSFHVFLPWAMSDMDNPDATGAVSDGARCHTSWPDHYEIEFRGSHEPLPASGSSELREECSGEVGAESTSEGNVVFIYSTIIRRAITPTVQDKVTGREPTTETQGTLYPSSNRRFAGDPDPEHESHPPPIRTLMDDNSDEEQLFPRSEPVVTAGLGVGARSITAALAGEEPIYDDDGDNIESVTEGDYTQRVWRQNEEHDTRECYQPIRLFQVISRGCRMMIPREKADGMDKRLGIDGTVLPDDEAPKCVFVGVSAITPRTSSCRRKRPRCVRI